MISPSSNQSPQFSIEYLVDTFEVEEPLVIRNLLRERGYQFLFDFEPTQRDPHELLYVNKELDPQTLEIIKKAGYKVYRQL